MSFYSQGALSQTLGHIKSIDDENAQRNYEEKTQQINRDSQTTSLLNNTIGAGLGTFGGGLTAVRQTVKRVKQLKDKLFVKKRVSDLMKPLDESERRTIPEDFFKDDFFKPNTESSREFFNEDDLLGTVRDTLGGETKQDTPFSRDIFSEIEEEQKPATRVSDLFTRSKGDIPILENQDDRDMRLAQIKSNFRDHLSELDEPQQQKFINEELDDKPDFYSQTFEQSVQRAQPRQEIQMSELQPKTSTSIQEAQSRDVVSNEPMFYRQTEEGVLRQPLQETEMTQAPEHAYVRSNEEILRTGYKDPYSYESSINDIATKTDKAMAPEGTTEMKPVIGSTGKQVGVSAEGADLTEGAAEGAAEGISGAVDAGIDTAAAAVDVGLNALDFIPVIGEITAAASLIGGIGLTIGSSIIGGQKAQEQQQSAEQQYNQQLNQGSNYAGKYSSNVFTTQHMFN